MKRPKIVRKLDIRHVLHNARADNPNTLPNRTRESNQINFDWQVPYVETRETLPGEETVGMLKKPFKMELKK